MIGPVGVEERLPGEDADEKIGPEGDDDEHQEEVPPFRGDPGERIADGDRQHEADDGGGQADLERPPGDGEHGRVGQAPDVGERPSRADAAEGIGRTEGEDEDEDGRDEEEEDEPEDRRPGGQPFRGPLPGSGLQRPFPPSDSPTLRGGTARRSSSTSR